MFSRSILPTLLLLLAAAPPGAAQATTTPPPAPAPAAAGIEWLDLVPGTIRRALAEDRLLLLVLDVPWSEAARVSRETVFTDARVIEAVRAGYLPVRMRADIHPDVRARYPAEAWPDINILLPDGTPLFFSPKEGQGEPRRMTATLLRPEAMAQLLNEARVYYEVEGRARRRDRPQAGRADQGHGTADPGQDRGADGAGDRDPAPVDLRPGSALLRRPPAAAAVRPGRVHARVRSRAGRPLAHDGHRLARDPGHEADRSGRRRALPHGLRSRLERPAEGEAARPERAAARAADAGLPRHGPPLRARPGAEDRGLPDRLARQRRRLLRRGALRGVPRGARRDGAVGRQRGRGGRADAGRRGAGGAGARRAWARGRDLPEGAALACRPGRRARGGRRRRGADALPRGPRRDGAGVRQRLRGDGAAGVARRGDRHREGRRLEPARRGDRSARRPGRRPRRAGSAPLPALPARGQQPHGAQLGAPVLADRRAPLRRRGARHPEGLRRVLPARGPAHAVLRPRGLRVPLPADPGRRHGAGRRRGRGRPAPGRAGGRVPVRHGPDARSRDRRRTDAFGRPHDHARCRADRALRRAGVAAADRSGDGARGAGRAAGALDRRPEREAARAAESRAPGARGSRDE